MAVDLMTAALPAALGIAAGFGLAILIFKKTISKKYGEARKSSRHASISYWCGVIALIAIANGLAGIFNELLFVLVNDSQIKSENIYKGAVGILIFPLIMLLFAFFLRTIFKDKASSTEITIKNEAHYSAALQEIKENRQREGLWAMILVETDGDIDKATARYIDKRVSELKSTNEQKISNPIPNKSRPTYILAALLLALLAIGIGAYLLSRQKNENTVIELLTDDRISFKKLTLSSCTACKTIAGKQRCVSTSAYQEIEVDQLKVTLKINDQYTTHPGDSEVCLISKENGFEFECRKSTKYGEFSMSNVYKYNGKNIFTTTAIVKPSASRTDLTEIECTATEHPKVQR